MPYDYYDYMKKQRDSDEYIKTSDLVRQNFWSESFNFNLSNVWLRIEDRILIRLYRYLRYN